MITSLILIILILSWFLIFKESRRKNKYGVYIDYKENKIKYDS